MVVNWPALQHFLPAKGAGQRLDQRAVDTGFLDGCGLAARRYDLFAATVFADGEGDMHGDGIGGASHAAASRISQTSPESPSMRR